MDERTQRIFQRARELVSDEARAKAAQQHDEWLSKHELADVRPLRIGSSDLHYALKDDALVMPEPRAGFGIDDTAVPEITPLQMIDAVGMVLGEIRQQLRDEFATEVKELRREIGALRARLALRDENSAAA